MIATKSLKNTELRSLDLKTFFFIAILILLGYVMLQVIYPFLNIIVVALVIVQIFHPVYQFLNRNLKNAGLSSLLSTIFTILVVVIPTILIIFLAMSEVGKIVDSNVAQTGQGQVQISPSLQAVETQLADLIGGINGSLKEIGVSFQLQKPDLGKLAYDLLNGLQASLFPFVSGVISFSISALFTAFIFIISLLYLFSEYENLPRFISRISPLDDELDELLLRKFTETTRAVIIGSFVVALAQASAVSVALLLIGVGAPVLLWIIMVILSLVPIGSGLVWAPVGLALILSGQAALGILLVIYSAIIINVIDTLLRPIVLRSSIKLHPLIIIFSALGGINLFGPLGILYGPLIVVFFTSLMDVYTSKYAGQKLHHNPKS